jgi:hypothetical protein
VVLSVEHTQTTEAKDLGAIIQMLSLNLEHFLIVKSSLMITRITQPNWLPSTAFFLMLGSRFWLTAADSRKWRQMSVHVGHS